jgi:hypothetical protein
MSFYLPHCLAVRGPRCCLHAAQWQAKHVAYRPRTKSAARLPCAALAASPATAPTAPAPEGARPLIKICGLTSAADAEVAAAAGADLLGMIMWQRGRRAVSPATARDIAATAHRHGAQVLRPPAAPFTPVHGSSTVAPALCTGGWCVCGRGRRGHCERVRGRAAGCRAAARRRRARGLRRAAGRPAGAVRAARQRGGRAADPVARPCRPAVWPCEPLSVCTCSTRPRASCGPCRQTLPRCQRCSLVARLSAHVRHQFSAQCCHMYVVGVPPLSSKRCTVALLTCVW